LEVKRIEGSDEIIIFEYLIVIARKKKLIAGITFGISVVALIVSLILPPIYRAEIKILPPQPSSTSMASQLLSQLGGGMATLATSAIGIKNPNDMYIGMLKSRTVYDRIVDGFGLMKVYDVQYREDARKKLDKSVGAKGGKDGIITVTVEDKDPKRAAEMANALVEELKQLSKGLAVTEAAQRRLFFEEQLTDVKMSLIKAEEGIKGFQEKTGVLKIDDQARAVIAGIASLRAQIAAKEVQQKVIRTYATAQNPDLQRIEEEARGLQAELQKLETKGGIGHDPLMSTGRMPSVGTDYMRKLRDVKYNETLYELLAKQYEMAKLDEARDAVVFQVIDKAVAPEKRVKPKRTIIVFLAILGGFLFSILLVLVNEYVRPKWIYWRKNFALHS
jgi:uncharacterized protein involved in exopolysaccharide biosynthesis